MNDEEWEHLCAALKLGGYLPAVVASPPTIIVRGELGTKLIARTSDGTVSVSRGLDQIALVSPVSVQSVLNLIVDAIGNPTPIDSLVSFASQVFGIKTLRPEVVCQIQWTATP